MWGDRMHTSAAVAIRTTLITQYEKVSNSGVQFLWNVFTGV